MTDSVDFWLFNGLKEEPYGLLPLKNLSAKGGPTTTKAYERVASYNWYLADVEKPTIIIPGMPSEYIFWAGGRLEPDHGVIIYDVNHFKQSHAPLDPLVMAVKATQPTFDWRSIDIITDTINLQKLFAFCRGDGEGLFRIDCERVGQALVLTRAEASDLMELDGDSFDHTFRGQCVKARNKLAEGPFNQMAAYRFGDFKMLVRYEADCADFSRAADYGASEDAAKNGPAPADAHAFADCADQLSYVRFGDDAHNGRLALMNSTTYPQGSGFPFFTWAQQFFSGADSTVVGWWKGRNDFSRPATYALTDINKLMKPLPYTTLSKVHDCLSKVVNFLRQNSEQLQVALLWKGGDHLEIYEKQPPNGPSALSPAVKDFLHEQQAIGQ